MTYMTTQTKEEKFAFWFGVPRKEIPWYPKIDLGQCVGCGLCAAICGRGVYKYDFESQRPIVAKPYNCLVGCQTCANLCPVGAIEFPDPTVLKKYIAKYKIFVKVREILEEKYGKVEVQQYKEQMNFIQKREDEITKEILNK